MKKSLVYSLSSVVLASSIFSGASLASASEVHTENVVEVNQTISLPELISTGEIKNANWDNEIYSVVYEKDNQNYEVEYNGKTNLVTINGEVQQDLSYEYNPELALNNSQNAVSGDGNTNAITYAAAKPEAGYDYVGTLSGNTKEAKNAASLAVQLGGLIPGAGWGIAGLRILLVYTGHTLSTDERIPEKYYSYDLYQKGFMTTKWYQYTTTTLFEDKAHKKASGKPWTSNKQHIDLPNS